MRTNRGIVLGLLICVALSLTACGINTSPGTGEKIGQVVKISKQGMMSDTWEAQLIRGGMNGGSGSFGTVPFDFTVTDDQTAALVTKYMQDQTEVVIHYRMSGFYSLFSTESVGHYLISIEPAKK